jgi:hypothetical protein
MRNAHLLLRTSCVSGLAAQQGQAALRWSGHAVYEIWPQSATTTFFEVRPLLLP